MSRLAGTKIRKSSDRSEDLTKINTRPDYERDSREAGGRIGGPRGHSAAIASGGARAGTPPPSHRGRPLCACPYSRPRSRCRALSGRARVGRRAWARAPLYASAVGRPRGREPPSAPPIPARVPAMSRPRARVRLSGPCSGQPPPRWHYAPRALPPLRPPASLLSIS